MGDFSLYDEHTQNLLNTLERLGLYETSLFDMLQRSLGAFGRPDTLIISPKAHNDLMETLYGKKKTGEE